jgi:hypothetical protein
VLWKSGLLGAIESCGDAGAERSALATQTGLPDYGVGVLLEMAASAGVVEETGERYSIARVGSLLLHDRLTQVNFDFVHDVCYQGMFHLDAAIREGRPSGLQVFGDAPTIYQCLTELPEAAQRSWYAFDHYYSDRAFRAAAELVFQAPVRRLLDIGGNTGRWAARCLARDPAVEITLADLPGQLAKARDLLEGMGHGPRVDYHEVDLLGAGAALPGGFDVV